MKLNLNNDEIRRLYVEERKLIKEIAKIMHCGKTTIQSRLKEMGVETTKKNVPTGEQINYQITKKKSNNYNIHILAESRYDFEQLIFPYMIPSMYYKLKFLDILKAESVE